MKKHIFVLMTMASGLMLSACTSMQRFTMGTDKVAEFNLSGPTAQLRFTTDEKRVFATPNSDCVDLSRSGLINNEMPKRKDISFWSWKTPETKEFVTHDLGVQGLSINQLAQSGYDLYGDTYISTDMEVNAGKPLTIFIPKRSGVMFEALIDGSVSAYGFGLFFTPEANHQYQLIMEKGFSSNAIKYRARLLDVTDGTPVNDNRLIRNFRACKKTSE